MKSTILTSIVNHIEENEDFNVCEWAPVYFSADNVNGWPKVKDEDGEEDTLDSENFELVSVSLSGNKVVIHAGGDYQPPHEVQIEFDGSAYNVTKTIKIDSVESGLNTEEFLGLFKVDISDDLALKREDETTYTKLPKKSPKLSAATTTKSKKSKKKYTAAKKLAPGVVAEVVADIDNDGFKGQVAFQLTEKSLKDAFKSNPKKFLDTLGIPTILDNIGADECFDYFS